MCRCRAACVECTSGGSAGLKQTSKVSGWDEPPACRASRRAGDTRWDRGAPGGAEVRAGHPRRPSGLQSPFSLLQLQLFATVTTSCIS